MPRCIVQGCPHYSGRKNSTPGVAFHMFPKNLATIKRWLLQINQNFGDVDTFAQGVYEGKAGVIRICSAHFAMECYRFSGSQRILLENAMPTIFPDKPAVKLESSPCPMIFSEKQKIERDFYPIKPQTELKMESAACPMSEMEKMAVKVENVPVMSGGNEKPTVKVEAARPPKTSSKRGGPDVEEPTASSEGTLPPSYWNNPPLQMPMVPFLPVNMANPLCASNELAATWSTNGGANIEQKHTTDFPAPKPDTTRTENHADNGISTDNVSDMQNAGHLSTSVHDYDHGCPIDLSSEVQKEDKAVQWPENDSDELVWKVLHDHYYKVRRTIERSALRNGIENCHKQIDSEGELLATLQYVTSVLLKNRRKRELKTARILNQTLEIIALVTGEEWVIVKKDSIHKGIHELTGEVPVKCGNVAVFFTMDEWSYIERHRQEYAETVAENGPVPRTWKVRDNWDSEEEYISEGEVEEAENSPKRKSSPEWQPGCDSSAEEEERQESNPPTTLENGEPEKEQQECDACGERLTSKEDLLRHKAANHSAKRYPCPICGIQYDYKSQFIIHQRAHTGEKPFVCQECGAKFGHKSSFLVHERRHKEGKTFECAKCDRRFDKKCELVKHEKTHSQKKRHKCHKCGKRYLSRSALMRHKWAHKDE